jgi:hypothetical protein
MCETAEPDGWLVDACRRAVGLATAPNIEHPLHLVLALWLDRVLVELASCHRVLRWADAALLAPMAEPDRCPTPPALGAAFASQSRGWARLRFAAASGQPVVVPIESAHAAWMDTPMFARWCLGFFPDLNDLRNDLAFLATGELTAQIEASIESAFAAFDS